MEFIGYKIAKKLEEKGFTLDYNPYGYKPIYTDANTIKLIWDKGAYGDDYFGENIPCPTVSQVLDWLRKTKKIYVSVDVEREDWFEYKIVQTIEGIRWTGRRVYETHDSALLAGIECAVNDLI